MTSSIGKSIDKVGDTYRGFRVTKFKEIPEIRCTLRELVHEATGAEVLHLANDDPENLFCLSFKTRPSSSNGVAHILEHTVLCGSEKFPVKDPFFSMTRRSLNTFMNAMTGSDFTCYPASSQVPADFYNLLDVYLDAVFHPKLEELSFRQEGHRLEFAEPDSAESALEFKGIVFNEMKGAMSSPTARLYDFVSESLLPDLTYAFNSGGDPAVIPQLSYEEFKKFHEENYHPGRCLFFFYGNLPLEENLDFIASRTLDKCAYAPPLDPIPRQKRFAKPVYRQESYPLATDQSSKDKTFVAFAWLTCHLLEQEEVLALEVLDSILTDTDASPLKMTLLKSGLCRQVSSSLDDDITEVPWVMVMKGCNPENADKLEAILFDRLKEIAKEGIPQDLVDAAIHQAEFYRSEITGNSQPFGLTLFMRSALLKQHGGDAENGLIIHTLFSKLRERLAASPRFFSEVMEKYLINNLHRLRLVLSPEADLAKREEEEEQKRLQDIRAGLDAEAVDRVIQEAAHLSEHQEAQLQQNLDCLPKVTLADVPPQPRDYPLAKECCGNLEVFHHDCFTNGIVYAELVYPLPRLTEEELPYVRLLTNLIGQMGCGGRDYVETLEHIQAHIGGIGASLNLNVSALDKKRYHPALHIRGKALHQKGEQLFTLFADLVQSLDLTDRDRLKEIIQKHFTALEGGFVSQSMRYAQTLSASGLDTPSYLTSHWAGLEYFHMMRELAHNLDARIEGLIETLIKLRDRLMPLDNAQLVLSCQDEYYVELKERGFYGLQEVSGKSYDPWVDQFSPQLPAPQGRVVASPVAFIALTVPTIGYADKTSPALNIAANLLQNKTLHHLIREEGGAYGGGTDTNPMCGHFYFYSYRDPHVTSTYEAFQQAIADAVAGRFSAQDLEEAKLEVIQDFDSPVAPGSRASVAFGWLTSGKTLEMRRQYRQQTLATTKEEVIAALKENVGSRLKEFPLIVFGGKELLEKENASLNEKGLPPLQIEKV